MGVLAHNSHACVGDVSAQLHRKENAMMMFLAACVHQCVRGQLTSRCTHRHLRRPHDAARSTYVLGASPARQSGDMHACFRKAQGRFPVLVSRDRRELHVPIVHVQLRSDPALEDLPHHLLVLAKFTLIAGFALCENRASARRCIYLSVLLYCCCEESGDDHSARTIRLQGVRGAPWQAPVRPPCMLCTE